MHRLLKRKRTITSWPVFQTDHNRFNSSLPIQDQPRLPDCIVRIHHDFVIFQTPANPPINLVTKCGTCFSLAHGSRNAPDVPNRNRAEGRFVVIRPIRFSDRHAIEEHRLVVRGTEVRRIIVCPKEECFSTRPLPWTHSDVYIPAPNLAKFVYVAILEMSNEPYRPGRQEKFSRLSTRWHAISDRKVQQHLLDRW